MHVTLLAGAETAPWAHDLAAALSPDDRLTVVVSTGRDVYAHGLKRSPALDAVVRALAAAPADDEPTFHVADSLASLAAPPAWFRADDVDVALAVLRTELLTQGFSLSEVTAAVGARQGVTAEVLPMSDDRVELHAVVRSGDATRAVHVDELLASRSRAENLAVVTADPSGASPAPGVLAALTEADAVVVGPLSTPLTLLPLLTVKGVRDALTARGAVGRAPSLEPVAELLPLATELAYLEAVALPGDAAGALAVVRTLT